jgi:hypothetical protein
VAREEFEILGEIDDAEVIAVGRRIRELARLTKRYGRGRWRKMKGSATIRLRSGLVRRAEIHWYEAHGIGRRDFKRKRYLSNN